MAGLRRRLRDAAPSEKGGRHMDSPRADHQQWPNRWFAKQGLYSLEHGACEYV